MTTPTHDLGDKRRLTVTFTDINAAAADPTTITFRMLEPDDTQTSYVYGTDPEVVKSATGIYYVDWDVAQAGRHSYRFIGTGTVAQAAEADFYGLRSESA